MSTPESPRRGDHRITAGVSEFYTGIKWLPYPASLAELTKFATEAGWGVDEGIMIRYRFLRTKEGETVQPYIRVLIGREPGGIADSDDKSLGYQFHLLVTMGARSWSKPDGYVKTSDTASWVGISGVTEVRQTISRNRLVPEPVYVEANN